jgi:hypothetical protein
MNRHIMNVFLIKLENRARNESHSMEQSLFQKLIVTLVVKKSPAFYRSQRFINVFTRARH